MSSKLASSSSIFPAAMAGRSSSDLTIRKRESEVEGGEEGRRRGKMPFYMELGELMGVKEGRGRVKLESERKFGFPARRPRVVSFSFPLALSLLPTSIPSFCFSENNSIKQNVSWIPSNTSRNASSLSRDPLPS